MARAAVLQGFGGSEVLVAGEVKVAEPGPGQIRVSVRIAGVGPTDVDIRAGRLERVFKTPPGSVLGFEAAGTVESIGDDVDGVRVGDAVAAFLPGLGGYAELVVADHWVLKPEQVAWEDAGALPAAAEAAGRVLGELELGAGETLLVLGATGSVGLIATQLAVARGVRVLAAVRPGYEEVAERLGAEPVRYGPDLAGNVRALSAGRDAGVDAVLDAASTSDLETAIELAGGTERVITLSNHDAPRLGVRLSGPDPARVDASLAAAMTALAAGRLTMKPHAVLPLEAVGEAHALIESGDRRKLLLRT